ncbi:MAG: hypothetical protein EZS26_000925 [Candidatus Ordinivivax streblomastigis]|uniref:Laminin G domain-containing protein n=1 Tax=Candidatus Ordinivivax streblomastigis TaxID=2540710 RepID=A0A5M8P2R1_9BACT|nr:MAG: hypothetical protein EZS26_000925 [Candidatus Ordinivivax streblomastigis]
MKNKIILLFLIGITSFANVAFAQVFLHPGISNTEDEFALMRRKVAEHAEPWYTTWNNLLKHAEAQLSWTSHATATVDRPGNIAVMYRDAAAVYEQAIIYKVGGDTRYAVNAVNILNSWANTNTTLTGNGERYLAAGNFGYQFAAAAEMMRDYPGFNVAKFQNYLLNVFYYPLCERFLCGNVSGYGAAHNDACATNYRVNWDAGNLASMAAISIFCDNKTNFDRALNYAKNGDGTGQIGRAVPFIHSEIWGQWEESLRDQGHSVGGLTLYAWFCQFLWNQGIDFYGYDNSRFRKGAEYVAYYNIMDGSEGKYPDPPKTEYCRRMGTNCAQHCENDFNTERYVRGKLGAGWEMIYNHYARVKNEGDKVHSVYEILQQAPSDIGASTAIHADTYDTPGFGTLTFRSDSSASILPWRNMDVYPYSVTVQPHYGSTIVNNNTITVTGSGDGIQSTADNFQFAFQRVIDNGAIVAKIDGITGASGARSGIMIRGTLKQNAANVFLSLSLTDGIILSSRNADGSTTTEIAKNSNLKTTPQWLKLTRNDNLFTAEISANGQAWTPVGTITVEMPRDSYYGMAVSGQNKNETATATFNAVEITKGNIKPMLTVSAPLEEKKYVENANVTIKGNALDLDGSVSKVEIYGNETLLKTITTIAADGSFEYLWSGVAAGNYQITIKVTDNGGDVIAQTKDITVSEKNNDLPTYLFNEGTGNTIKDVSGATKWTSRLYGGLAFGEGKSGTALSFDGVDDYVALPKGFIETLSDFSVSMWVKPLARTNWARLLDFGSGTGSYLFLAPCNDAGYLTFTMLTSEGTKTSSATKTLTLNQWQHLTVTLGNNTLKMYLNGTLVANTSNFTLRPYDLDAPANIYIGKSQYTADPYFKGLLDNLRFYNYPLTVDEINQQIAENNTTGIFIPNRNERFFSPNPATDHITISGQSCSQVSISDLLGKLVLHHTMQSENETVNVSHLPTGVYVIRVKDVLNNSQTSKLVKR